MTTIYIILASIGIYFLVAFLSITGEKIKRKNGIRPAPNQEKILKESAEIEKRCREHEINRELEIWDQQQDNAIMDGYYDDEIDEHK